MPPVQMELFTEAGAIVGERAARFAASRESVAGILRRAAEQAAMLPLGAKESVTAPTWSRLYRRGRQFDPEG